MTRQCIQRGIRAGVAALGVGLCLASFAGAEPLVADDRPVYPNAEATRPLAVGDTIPNVTVRSIDGEGLDLASVTRESGALLVFYRGGW